MLFFLVGSSFYNGGLMVELWVLMAKEDVSPRYQTECLSLLLNGKEEDYINNSRFTWASNS